MSLTFVSNLLGTIEYNEADVYHFASGLPGFSELRKFVFIQPEDIPFIIMHSIEEDLSFFLINPFERFSDYELIIPDVIIEQLKIENRDDVLCYSIVVLREPLIDSTANMAAPLIINTKNRKGIQLVLDNASYSIRQPIFIGEPIQAEKG